jgi:hypothetical protein
MKKIFVICFLALFGTVLFAQSDDASIDVRAGGRYILKAADGSGKVPLFEEGSDTPALYVDDGLEVRPFQLSRDKSRFNIEHGYNKYYWIDVANVGEETAYSIESRLRQEQKSIFENPFFAILLIIAAMILVHTGNKIYTRIALKKYYDEKLTQFEWLRDWVKKNPKYISIRTKAHAGSGLMMMQIVFWGGMILTWLIVSFILGGIFGVHVGNDTPVAMFCIYGGLLLLAELAAIKSIGVPKTSADRKYGGTLECPTCGCPHSWGMLFHHNDVRKTRTVTTTTWEGDDDHVVYRKNVWGEWKSTKKTEVSKYHYGKVIQDFKCDNCGNKQHYEFGEEWTGSLPDTTPKHFNPPDYAFDPVKEETHWYDFFVDFFTDSENVRNLVMSLVCAFLTMYFWKWVLYIPLEDTFMNEMTFKSRLIMYGVATGVFAVINGLGWWLELGFIRVVSIIFAVVGLFFLIADPVTEGSDYIMLKKVNLVYAQKEVPLYSQPDAESGIVENIAVNSKLRPTREVSGEWVAVKFVDKNGWIHAPKLSKKIPKRWREEW